MTTPPWTFGNQPLDEQRELATLLREVATHALALEHPTDALRELLGALRAAEPHLRADVPADLGPRVAHRTEPDRRVYLDHARDVGAYNPAFPVYELRCAGDAAEGGVELTHLHEGPPGTAHGGSLALLFDCVLQQLNCDLGIAGRTTSLEVRYRRPVPLHRWLRITAERAVDGDRITAGARLWRDDTVLCEATMRSEAGRHEDLPVVAPRRRAP